MKKIYIYLLAINLLAFLCYFADKKLAQKNTHRIRERTLILLSLAGGSIGSLVAMNLFRHKTKKGLFKYGLPIILLGQVILAWWLWKNGDLVFW